MKVQKSIEHVEGISLTIVMIIIILIPFSNILHYVIPLPNIFGKSTWVVGPTLIMVFIYFYKVIRSHFFLSLDRFELVSWVLVILSILIFSIRSFVYNENVSYLTYRYIATGFIYLYLVIKIVRNDKVLRFLAMAIVAQGFLVSLAQVINVHFFPTVALAIDAENIGYISFDTEKTRNMLQGASISANLILCAMFVMVAMLKAKVLPLNYTFFWIFQLFMLYAITLGGSRYPFIVGCLLIIFNFFTFKSSKFRLSLIFIVITILFSINYLFNFHSESIIRDYENYGDRIVRFTMPIQILGESIQNFVIGSSIFQVGNTVSSDGNNTISDQSYFATALAFGVPLALAYFTTIFSVLKNRICNNISKWYFYYFALSFAFTNCILWENWLCVSIFSAVVISDLSQINPGGTQRYF